MRKWHRWLSVFFGVFLLFIATTGVLSQIVPFVQRGGFESEATERLAKAKAAAATPPGFVCPETMMCRPKPKSTIVGTLHHLHSGESFGPLGTIIATLSGLAMMFFSFSGLWLYLQMWRNRKARSLKGGMFWK